MFLFIYNYNGIVLMNYGITLLTPVKICLKKYKKRYQFNYNEKYELKPRFIGLLAEKYILRLWTK